VFAVALVIVATTAIVFGVALVRAGRRPEQVAAAATEFATSAPGIMTAAVVSSAVLTAVALVSARRQARNVRELLRLGPGRATATGIGAAVVAMGGITFASGTTIDLFGLRGQSALGAIAQALGHVPRGQLALAMATIAIAPGAAEEIFFRGFIQTWLTSKWGRWPSILATAAGFGLMHFDLAQGSAAFFAGLLLGWLVERFGSIRPSIAVHMFNNAVFVAWTSFGSGPSSARSGEIAVLATSAVALVGAVLVLQSKLAVRSVAA